LKDYPVIFFKNMKELKDRLVMWLDPYIRAEVSYAELVASAEETHRCLAVPTE